MSSSTETVTATPGIVYTLDDRGVITRQAPGEKPVKIAAIKDGKLRWSHKDFEKHREPVERFLQAQNLRVEFVRYKTRAPQVRDALLVSSGREHDDADTDPAGEPAEGTAAHPDGVDGMKRLTVEQRKAVNQLRAKEGYPLGELERPAPLAPEKTSGAGDKTEAYVRWLLRYYPAEFCRVYGVERIGSIEVTIPGKRDPVTRVKGPARRVWEDGHVLAKRATIFTKVVANKKPANAKTAADIKAEDDDE